MQTVFGLAVVFSQSPGAAWNDAMVARWSANLRGKLWSEVGAAL